MKILKFFLIATVVVMVLSGIFMIPFLASKFTEWTGRDAGIIRNVMGVAVAVFLLVTGILLVGTPIVGIPLILLGGGISFGAIRNMITGSPQDL
jgi:hypothetical protein